MIPNIRLILEQIKNDRATSCTCGLTRPKRVVSPVWRYIHGMLSVIVTTEDSEHAAVATLSALVPAAAAGVVRDVVLVDRGGSESIARVADIAGCAYLAAPGSRAQAMAAGATQGRASWLMFLEAGAVLDPGWIDEASQFVQAVESSGAPRAATFSVARSPFAHISWRDWAGWLDRASRERGLLIARDHYTRLGGFRSESKSPEQSILRRLGRSSRTRLRSRIVLS